MKYWAYSSCRGTLASTLGMVNRGCAVEGDNPASSIILARELHSDKRIKDL